MGRIGGGIVKAHIEGTMLCDNCNAMLKEPSDDIKKLTKELILSLVWDMPRHNMEMGTDVSDNAEWLYKKLHSILATDPKKEPTFCKCGAEVCPRCGNVHFDTPEMICLDKWHRDRR